MFKKITKISKSYIKTTLGYLKDFRLSIDKSGCKTFLLGIAILFGYTLITLPFFYKLFFPHINVRDFFQTYKTFFNSISVFVELFILYTVFNFFVKTRHGKNAPETLKPTVKIFTGALIGVNLSLFAYIIYTSLIFGIPGYLFAGMKGAVIAITAGAVIFFLVFIYVATYYYGKALKDGRGFKDSFLTTLKTAVPKHAVKMITDLKYFSTLMEVSGGITFVTVLLLIAITGMGTAMFLQINRALFETLFILLIITYSFMDMFLIYSMIYISMKVYEINKKNEAATVPRNETGDNSDILTEKKHSSFKEYGD